jgi:hypothetical protein
LFIGREQFSRIEAPFLAWEFVMKDGNDQPLAIIDRNFSGFGKELFTDAGKYAIHFGSTAEESAKFVQLSLDAGHPGNKGGMKAPVARLNSEFNSVIPCSSGEQLVLREPLTLDERLIALAAAISIDYDYFSRHSYGSGWLSPFIHVPVPMPVPPVPPMSMPESDSPEEDHTLGADSSTPRETHEGYDWGGFGHDGNKGDSGDENVDEAAWEEFDDFGDSPGDASGGLIDFLREWSDD